jgi:hypothetical protein
VAARAQHGSSYTLDWRWLLDREDSPWCPTLRLFRQSESRDYDGVITRMQVELKALVADWAQRGTVR